MIAAPHPRSITISCGSRTLEARVGRYGEVAAPAALIVLHDVTDHCRDVRRLARLAAALDALPAFTVIADSSGEIEAVNGAFCALAGCRAASVVGADASDVVFASLDDAGLSALWSAVEDRRPWYGTLSFTPAGRPSVATPATVVPLTGEDGGTVSGILVVGEPLTSRIEAGDDDGGRPSDASGAHWEVTAGDPPAQARKDRAVLLGEAIAALAHEVRQPLATIVARSQGSLDRLESGEATPGDLRASFETIRAGAARAADIVEAVSRLIRGDVAAPEPVDINAIVGDALTRASEALDRSAISPALDLADDLPPVAGRAVELEQVLDNLVNNAIDAIVAGNGGVRRLEVATKREPGGMRISVRDTGPGVPDASREHLFASFYTSKPSGLGLGLAIARGLVDGHGGRIWIDDPDDGDGGAAFCVFLPEWSAGDGG